METMIAPGFLVAAPQLKDPNFEGTVVLMIEHQDDEGSFGIVINRRASVDLSIVLRELGLASPTDLASHPKVLFGGPVATERGLIVHTDEWTGEATTRVGEGVAVTASIDLLAAISAGRGPRSYRFCLGYAGWGPGQLVSEIKAGAWITVPFFADLLFEVPLEDRWRAALAHLGIDPNKLVPAFGDA
ncbi:MAG: YqgE/AlgH family protein [Deltaproteobacteria bacterium]|nr:YqgE/AlgH family protein [Deltaproteobacteria bacterium]